MLKVKYLHPNHSFHFLRIKLSLLCFTRLDLFPEDELKDYTNKFLNKPIESEYYVDKIVESKLKLKLKFIKHFENHKLLQYIGLNKKYNQHYLKEFNCNLKLADTKFEIKLQDKILYSKPSN
ncbi:hypothetical protein RYX36_004276 [Vicia faba]